ncbi:hypothetical protein GIB67_017046 [Kingdonia uniflora]|uniref:NB-ARC domain-containing protein n=1 Tax=Kingdonia uniflora TaxID=39325 RepID=A0A7J7NCN8_9MAGN|nr:hypothetical protein GIB67_017046 [Kingdonia uniflora]
MKLFDKVVLATVFQNHDLRRIQTQIAESLGMKIEEQRVPARAIKLSARLKDSEYTYKVLITSKRLDVCNSMKTTKNIDIKVLSKNNSLELFRQEVGDADYDPLREMSEKIVNEYGGLPLAIVTLARTLIKEDKDVWTDVIPQLRKSMYEGMDIVNVSIKMSYNFLKRR